MPCLDLPNLLDNKPLKSEGLLQELDRLILFNNANEPDSVV